MATLQDLITKINGLPVVLADFMPNELEVTAKDYIALVVTKIRREGIGSFRYSNKPGVPAYLYKGKNGDYPQLLNAAGRAFIDKKIKEGVKAKKGKFKGFVPFGSSSAGLVNWKGIRQAQGLQTAFVDVSYSNHMLNNIGITGKQSNGTIYTANIGGLTPDSKKKLGYNLKRYGKFLNADQSIRNILTKASGKRISTYIYNKIGAVKK